MLLASLERLGCRYDAERRDWRVPQEAEQELRSLLGIFGVRWFDAVERSSTAADEGSP
jgi:hypothetical protein